MDQISEELEFLDLSDLGEKERHHVQSVLYSRNPNAAYPQLPWQVSVPASVDPYQDPADEVQWNHKQQYDTENPGEVVSYEGEACEVVIDEEGGAAEQPVEYQSPSNVIPATSVFMVPNYNPGIMNMYGSVTQAPMYQTPTNEINGSPVEPRRNMSSKMGMKGMQKMGIRHRQPNVDPVDVMPSHQNPFYYQMPQYPYFPGPPNQLAGAPMSAAQQVTGTPMFLQPTLVNPYPAPVYYQSYCSPPLPMNQHPHETLEVNAPDNGLVKSEFLEEVPVVSVENSVPYNNNIIEENTNMSNRSVNSSLNTSGNHNNNNNYDFSSIEDKVAKSSEISANPTESILSEAVDDKNVNSNVGSTAHRGETVSHPDAANVGTAVSTNSSEPVVKKSENSINCSVSVSQTVTSVKSAVSSNADSGGKQSHALPAHSAQPTVSNKSDSANTETKVSSSLSPVSSSSAACNNTGSISSCINDNSAKSISKGKDATPPSSSLKLEKPAVSPALTNGPASEVVAPARRTWASLLASNAPKPVSSPTVFSVNRENASHTEQTPTAPTHKTGSGSTDMAAVAKSKNLQSSPRPQAPRNVAKHRSGAPTKSQKNETSASNDVYLQKIAELLSTYKLDHKVVNLLPRGLNNRSSYCYINATLQALLACPPLYNLLKAISSVLGDFKKNPSESSIPFISSLVSFVEEFSPLPNNVTPRKQKPPPPSAQKHSKNHPVEPDPKTDPAFEPSFIYKMLASLNSDSGGSFNVEGRQEDAEEFLSCLLNGLNDEMVELKKYSEDSDKKGSLSNGDIMVNGDTSQQNDHGAEWQRVKAKNKSAIVRDANVERTPLSDIFRGKLKSQVSRSGGLTSCNIQPFFTLQLDIEKAKSVSEALGMLVDRDQLEGVTCSKTNQEVEAWQKMTLEELPCVLLLHLKCFDFKQQVQSCGKIIKNIDCPIDLELNSKWMSYRKTHNKKYKLFAVVYHEGKEATKGHYIADVYHHGYESWIRYDDSNVKFIDESEFLKPKPPRVPYLLYYKRIDTLPTPVNAKSQSVNSTLKNR